MCQTARNVDPQSASKTDPALREALGSLGAVIAQICGAESGSTPTDFACAAAQLERGHSLTPVHRLNGRLPERVTENELLRRYGVTRGRIARILRRIAGEGWIERLPGHGWAFLPVLTSLEAYEDSYRFRLLIEPAAILEPRFMLNKPVLERCREQQQWLVDGGEVSDAQLFELNSGMHQAIIECSQNSFFVDALKRINRVRRLVEYRQALDRHSVIARCREHIQLLDLLLADKREEASEFMRQHLSELAVVKPVARKKRRD
jgi:DNA-binding GntR family transcriptional regulator